MPTHDEQWRKKVSRAAKKRWAKWQKSGRAKEIGAKTGRSLRKLSDEDVALIIGEMSVEFGPTLKELAARLGVTPQTLSDSLKRAGAGHLPRARMADAMRGNVRGKGRKLTPAGLAKMQDRCGDKNPYWKGVQAGYCALHDRVQRQRGKAVHCSRCGTTDKERWYDWANLTGNYQNVQDYAPMCRACHIQYDRARRARS